MAAVACCSQDAEVSIFWIDASRKLQRYRSTDYGATWGSAELIGYVPSTASYGMAAAYKPNSDLAVFYIDQDTLYVIKYTGGSWQSPATWDKTTGDLSGVACIYDGDWNLVITGQDTNGNYRMWSVVYGDGGEISAGSWSSLQEMAVASAGGDFAYSGPCLDKPDVFRCFFIDEFTGTDACNRYYWSNALPDTSFPDSLWRESQPFDFTGGGHPALTHYGDYIWLTCPSGVWLAPLTTDILDLSEDITDIKETLGETGGTLTVTLRNDGGRYATPGSGELSLLEVGAQVDFSPGYRTTAGNEVSTGQTFMLESWKHTVTGGKATFTLHARDGWDALNRWTARHQLRWNKSSQEASVKQIMERILAKAGLKLEIISQSATLTDFYPDFTVHAGNTGTAIIRRLLDFVSDVLFIEGNRAYMVNPTADDTSVYGYGTGHDILSGDYESTAMDINRVRVEGYDSDTGNPIITDSLAWAENDRLTDRFLAVSDRNIGTVAEAQARGQAYLRQAEIAATNGNIIIPTNCGQQLYDVIKVTAENAGLNAAKRRVRGISLFYDTRRGKYEQSLVLGAV